MFLLHRKGHKGTVSYDCIPQHLRKDILEKVRETYLEGINQVIQNDQRAARELAAFEHQQTLNEIHHQFQQHQREIYRSLRPAAAHGGATGGATVLPARVLPSFLIDERIRSGIRWSMMRDGDEMADRILVSRMNVVPSSSTPTSSLQLFPQSHSIALRQQQLQQPIHQLIPVGVTRGIEQGGTGVEIHFTWRDAQEHLRGIRSREESSNSEAARSLRPTPLPRPVTPPPMTSLLGDTHITDTDDLDTRVINLINRVRDSLEGAGSSNSSSSSSRERSVVESRDASSTMEEGEQQQQQQQSPLLASFLERSSGLWNANQFVLDPWHHSHDNGLDTVAQGPVADAVATGSPYSVARTRESVTLIVYVYWKSAQSISLPGVTSNHTPDAEILQWNIKGLEYKLSRSGREDEDEFEMSRCQVRQARMHTHDNDAYMHIFDRLTVPQVHHLSECMRELDATSLRFTVYTRNDDGGIVELLNTGMIGIRRFLNADGQRTEHEEDARRVAVQTEIVLDYEDDVRIPRGSSATPCSLGSVC